MHKTIISNIYLDQGVIATLYFNESYAKGAIVAKGAPGSWDEGNNDYKELSEKYKINIIVPDYLGFARSDGNQFNIKNCVDTLLYTANFLTGKTSGLIIPENKKIKLHCKKIVVIGSSFGGSVVPLIPLYYPNRKDLHTLGLLAPLTDWATQAKDSKIIEESMEEFNLFMLHILHNIYRNYKKSEFYAMSKGNKQALEKYNPISKNNILLLKNHVLFIAHGNKDKSINWKKSLHYANLLKTENISVELNILQNIKHGGNLKRKGLDWIFQNFTKQI